MKPILPVRVESLFIYPIKSCAGIAVSMFRITELGLIEGDREWIVVDTNGEGVWQGSHPRLALVRPELNDALLVLRGPGQLSVEISRMHTGELCKVSIWNDAAQRNDFHTAIDAGPEVVKFFQNVTGSDLRLMRLDPSAIASVCVNPVHVCSTTSLAELNQTLITQGCGPAETSRFRPNIVLSGIDEPMLPFIEEQITHLNWTSDAHAGEIAVYGKCIRCVVPNVNPDTAEVTEEPANAVARLSAERYPGEPSYFGVYGRTFQRTTLRQGEILEATLSV